MFSFAQKEPKGDLEREEFSPPGGDTVRLPLRKLDAHGGPGPRSNDGVRVQGQVEAWKGTNGGFKIVKNQSLSTSPSFFLSCQKCLATHFRTDWLSQLGLGNHVGSTNKRLPKSSSVVGNLKSSEPDRI